jgi:hypothetical protein
MAAGREAGDAHAAGILKAEIDCQGNRTLTIRRIAMRPTPYVSKDF